MRMPNTYMRYMKTKQIISSAGMMANEQENEKMRK